MIESLKKIIVKLPYVSKIYNELQEYKTWRPPGHYYSPIPDIPNVVENYNAISKRGEDYHGLELNYNMQKELLLEIKKFYQEIPYSLQKQPNLRYSFDNTFFCYADAISLYGILRHYSPKRIIEVGSGFSSSIMLDVNEHSFNHAMELTFIEPYPDRLHSLLKPKDHKRVKINQSFVQDVDLDLFRELKQNDILFIDSSHVSKTGSDLNYLLFQVIPQLQEGVIVHFHDIFHHFEYPISWIKEGRSWNESYLLRAFLLYNSRFQIILFNSYLGKYEREWLDKHIPLFLKNTGGSLWLQVNVK